MKKVVSLIYQITKKLKTMENLQSIKLNSYLQFGVIRDSITHEAIGFTSEYVQKAIDLSKNENVCYTRISENDIKFYGWDYKKDGTRFNFTSILGFFHKKLNFLIKNRSLSPLSPTEKY